MFGLELIVCLIVTALSVPTSVRSEPAAAAESVDAMHQEHGAQHGQHQNSASIQPRHSMNEGHAQLMVGPLGISRSRTGSGTSWLPDASPMYGLMTSLGEGGFMFHENVFAGYDWFGSDRGSDLFLSTNSLMAMAWHPLGPGEIAGRAMFSAEPATVGEDGYPLILQSGETADGQPLHDRQHPHDLFMELAATYAWPISSNLAVEIYLAPSGEPALGPTAFPHRVSAIPDPLAPLGHHWQDSTHIAFGVMTAGVFTRHLKLEGSWFNGREPDENRWDMDLDTPDSWSARLSVNPSETWSFQASYGFLDEPEKTEPGVSVQRVTSSVTYNLRSGAEANWATTWVFGENIPSEGPSTPSFLVESAWNVDNHHGVFGRGEYIRKAGHDLALPERLEAQVFDVGLLSLGYIYYFSPTAKIVPGLGVRGSVGLMEKSLETYYGTQLPIGFMIFGQLRPAAMSM